MTEEPTVLLTHHVSPEATETLRGEIESRLGGVDLVSADTPEQTASLLPDAEVVVTYRLSEDDLAAAEDLRWVQALSAGVDHYPLDALGDAGISLTNASGVHAEPIGEQVLGYMLAFERGLHTAIRNQTERHWEHVGGGELRDGTVGIVGVGAIGGRVAQLASAFGMDVIGTKRDTSTVPDGVDELYGADEYREVLRRADYLVLACPLTDETEGLIGRDELRLMPSDAVLINIARGRVVDESALVSALQRHRIGGAALDVFVEEPLPEDSPLWDLSNAIVTPHTAGRTPHYLERCADIFAENYGRFLADEALTNRMV